MAVFLSGYGVKNYRSLSSDGILLEKLGEINILIGQNNGGKSNILRSLDIWESHRRGKAYKPEGTDYHNNDNTKPIELEFIAPENKAREALGELVDGFTDKFSATYRLNGSFELIDSFARKIEPKKLHAYCLKEYSTASSELHLNASAVEKRAFDRIFTLPEIIFIDEKRGDATPTKIRTMLEPIWNHGAGSMHMRPIKRALIRFIEEAMQSTINIHFEPNGNSFSIETSEEKIVRFESLGSGIQQIFNIALKIATTRDSIIMIDELELNMHPGLLRRLMALIFANTSNQYFLSTHSNVLLDTRHEKSIYQVSGGNASSVTECSSIDETRTLLDDLGVKASDILQTNGIIWVEGPSDRTYINKLLELSDIKAEEGLDFTYQYYGGKLLAHYDLDDDLNDFVNILDINRNAYVVMDSDWKDSSRPWTQDDLAPRKKRVLESCAQKGIPVWVSSGTEIENYIPNSVWSKYAGKTVSLMQTENIVNKVAKYKDKAGESHKVASLFTKEVLVNELSEKITEIQNQIKSWNSK